MGDGASSVLDRLLPGEGSTYTGDSGRRPIVAAGLGRRGTSKVLSDAVASSAITRLVERRSARRSEELEDVS